MGEFSKIEWCDSTFNPITGCSMVSEGCVNCYAKDLSERFGRATWGDKGSRTLLSDKGWRDPLNWEVKAAEEGRPRLVFCASLGDVFEAWEGPILHHDKYVIEGLSYDDVRLRLFNLIDRTPNLIWMLLTKRPENIRKMWVGGQRKNVWLGTSVENRKTLGRIDDLKAAGGLAGETFLSFEPLLETLVRVLPNIREQISYVIAGGETGQGARPCSAQAVEEIRCAASVAGVPFMFKQWGDWIPEGQLEGIPESKYKTFTDGPTTFRAARLGKKRTGCALDGRVYKQFPASAKRG